MKLSLASMMHQVKLTKMRWIVAFGSCLILMFWLNPRQSAARQDQGRARYAAELRQLRDQLADSDTLSEADVVVILGQRVLEEAAQQLVGLEVKLASGAVLRLTSVAIEMKPVAAFVRIGVQASPSAGVPAALNLRLTGRLTGRMNGSLMRGAASGTSLRLPFQLT